MSAPQLVRVVGTGLIGTSIGLALVRRGVAVRLCDPSPTAGALARDLGAGLLATSADPAPDLVVVAAPPDVAGRVVAAELAAWPEATVTDVASVKCAVVGDVLAAEGDLSRYVGSHPMAGRERSGAVSGRADLFEGRPWVVVGDDRSRPESFAVVEALAGLVGSTARRMTAREHDEAVAAVSHVPQVLASLLASRLRDLPSPSVGLAGQGLRDVTRIAASDPTLWTQILVGNARAVRDVLADVAADLSRVIGALDGLVGDPDAAPGSRAVLAGVLAEGNAGHARIPGKHGSVPTVYAVITVVVPDRPGELARLLTEVGEEGVNLEDLRIEHEFGRRVGVAEIAVVPTVAEPLREALQGRGWTVHE